MRTRTADDFHDKAESLYSSQQYELALKEITSAIQLEPKRADCIHLRGLIYWGLNQMDKAVSDLTSALALGSTETSVYLDASKHLRDAIEVQKKQQQADSFNNEATILYDLKKYELALKKITSAIQLVPNCANSVYLRGLIYWNLNQMGNAVSDLTLAVSLGSTEAKAALTQAREVQKEQLQKLADCEEKLRELKRLQRSVTAFNSAESLMAEKKYDDALLEINIALEANPDFSNNYYTRGCIYWSLNNYGQAVIDFNAAIRLGHPEASRELASLQTIIAQKQGDSSKRLMEFEQEDISKLSVGQQAEFHKTYGEFLFQCVIDEVNSAKKHTLIMKALSVLQKAFDKNPLFDGVAEKIARLKEMRQPVATPSTVSIHSALSSALPAAAASSANSSVRSGAVRSPAAAMQPAVAHSGLYSASVSAPRSSMLTAEDRARINEMKAQMRR